MQPTKNSAGAPAARIDLPPIHVVRPACCPCCGAIAGEPGSWNLWGNGKRWREVIVLGEGTDRIVQVWVWRFWCRRCETSCSVSPADVIARHHYTMATILTAWFLAVRPIGDGLDDEAVYALVGVDRRVAGPERHRAGKRRWRSLARWAASIPVWWSARPVVGATWRARASALLVGFIPGDGGRDGAIRRALAAHAAGGGSM